MSSGYKIQYDMKFYSVRLSKHLDCSQSPIFSLGRRDTARLRFNDGHLDFQGGVGNRGL